MPEKEAGKSGPCSWNNNNLACTNTWAVLRGFGQLRPGFSDSGDLKMSELAFWNKSASPDIRKAEAAALAGQLETFFTKALLARPEEGFSQKADRIGQLAGKLSIADVTLCQLAATVDDVYNFRGEIK